jgi:hypothetical protein
MQVFSKGADAVARLGLTFVAIVVFGVPLFAAKATLIAAFFMDLITQPSVSRWAFALGIALAALLLIMVGTDVLTREESGLATAGAGVSREPHTVARTVRSPMSRGTQAGPAGSTPGS